MHAEIKNNKLVITMDLNTPPRPSATGKTLVVASTHGNQPTNVMVSGKPLTIGRNAYIPNR